jgi:tetratricopeptide (TPR) repeat protein/predicted Ser/Thr protein kinase
MKETDDSKKDKTTVLTGVSLEKENVAPPIENWDRYQLMELLGKGGMGEVYKAIDPILNRTVALKFIHGTAPVLRKRFMREARAQAQIDHNHVCKIYEVGEVAGMNYIAMQCIAGKTLDKIQHEMTVEEKVKLMCQVSDAVHSGHHLGIVHRDLKPTNIMVEHTESGWRPYVLDFGLAKEITLPHETVTGVLMGTPAYMSPEQAWGNISRLDRRSDIYSLGATFYDLLVERPPFEGSSTEILYKLSQQDPEPLRKIDPGIPKDLETILMKCLEKDPSRRYETARALGEDLQRYLDGEPILARPTTRSYRLMKKVKKHKVVANIFALFLLMILILGGFSLYEWWRSGKELELTREFAQLVEPMEWQMRLEQMAPLHDIRGANAGVRQRMKVIEERMKDAGKFGIGPGNYSLGRGYMTLDEYDQAKSHLEKAWNSGYRGPEVAFALGVTFGNLYQREFSALQGMDASKYRDQKMKEVQRRYRDPAVSYLKLGQNAKIATPEYAVALIAFCQERYEEALKKTREAAQRTSWFYDAKVLEGKIYQDIATKKTSETDYFAATKSLLQAEAAYQSAITIAASDAKAYEGSCAVQIDLMHNEFYGKGVDMNPRLTKAIVACDQALKLDPQRVEPYALESTAYNELVGYLNYHGLDSASAREKSIEASKKAIALSPQDASLYYQLGESYMWGLWRQWSTGVDIRPFAQTAITNYQKSVHIDSTPQTWNDLGWCYYYIGQFEIDHGVDPHASLQESIASYEKAVRIDPAFTLGYSNLATTLLSLGAYEVEHGITPGSLQKANDILQKALKMNPNLGIAHRHLAGVFVYLARWEQAMGQDPRDSISKAIEHSMKSSQMNPELAAAVWTLCAYREKARYEREHGLDPQESIRAAEKSVMILTKMNIQWAPIYFEICELRLEEARFAIGKGNSPFAALQEGRQNLEKAFSINPKLATNFLTQGKLELLSAQWRIQKESIRKSREAFERSIQLNPNNADAFAGQAELDVLIAESTNAQKQRYEAALDAQTALTAALRINRNQERLYMPISNQIKKILSSSATKTTPHNAI